MNSKSFMVLMAVASGLLIFVLINSNSEACITCNLWDEEEQHEDPIMHQEIAPSQICHFGVIDGRCMFEDEYYKITEGP